MQAHQDAAVPRIDRNISPPVQCFLYNIERISYTDALALQHRFHEYCVSGRISGMLLLLEHDPVITMGVKTRQTNILASAQLLDAMGIQLVETDRGGDVTYHGPGQLVGYPILPLRGIGCDLHAYLRTLEQCIIDTLGEFGLEGRRNGPAGVWVGDKKVCSIGIAVRKWVTYHGFALNVNPNLSHFSLINPCGLEASRITSMAELLSDLPAIEDVRRVCERNFAKVFKLKLVPWGEGAC